MNVHFIFMLSGGIPPWVDSTKGGVATASRRWVINNISMSTARRRCYPIFMLSGGGAETWADSTKMDSVVPISDWLFVSIRY